MNRNTWKRHRILPVLMLSVLFVLTLTGVIFAREGLKFSLDPQWVFAGDQTEGKTYTMTFTLQGQSRDNWQSLFEIVETPRKSYPKMVGEAHTALVEARLGTCPDTSASVIAQDETTLIFEMFTAGCPSIQDQYQLARILYGKKKVYVMIFSRKAPEAAPEMRQNWFDILRAAKVQ